MIEHITYIAEDGTEFEVKEDCLAYENKKIKRFNNFYNNVKAYDEKGQRMLFSTEDDFIRNYDETTFLVIDDNLSEDSVEFLYEQYGHDFPLERGVYRYDYRAYEWVEFNEAWAPIADIIKEWYF